MFTKYYVCRENLIKLVEVLNEVHNKFMDKNI